MNSIYLTILANNIPYILNEVLKEYYYENSISFLYATIFLNSNSFLKLLFYDMFFIIYNHVILRS